MKRLLVFAVLLLFGFYVVWPGWSAYSIDSAIKTKDAETLAHKIDFASVRDSLRPAVTQKVADFYDQQIKQTGPTGALVGGQLKQAVLPGVVDALLAGLVTPENLIRVAHEGGQLKESVERLLGEELRRAGRMPGLGTGGAAATGQPVGGPQLPGGLGDLSGIAGKIGIGQPVGTAAQQPPASKAAQPPAAPPSYGLDNVKHFAILGPMAFEIGVAKDKTATEPDVTAELRFTGMDWKVTAVRPRL
ncbi:MAG TPA: DUF2939 domain-containing protein [Hyphomicrobiaceae bacterium]|nr:DUF2939 domain-containing protein [Hyphomicrobiaceae bacterium]